MIHLKFLIMKKLFNTLDFSDFVCKKIVFVKLSFELLQV